MTSALAGESGPIDHLAPTSETKALSQYRVDSWRIEQGLPMDLVHVVLQTQDGYLWLGTARGLARFDGKRFTTFEAAEVPEVASMGIFGLMEDKEKTLWIGHNKGAVRYHHGVFQPAFSSDVTAGQRVYAFAQASDGSVWSATENGLVHWADGVTRLYQQKDGLPTKRLRSLAFDRAGVLWIATSGGGLVSLEQGNFRVLNPENGFPHLQVRSVLADPDGSIWATTAGAGLVHISRGKITNYTIADGLPTDQLTSLSRDSQGSLWIGTWGAGISRMNGGRFSTLSTKGGLAGDHIWSILADREGSVWIGTWVGGLNRLSKRSFDALGTPEGLSHDNVRTVLHDRNDVTWVATAGGGLNRIEAGRITTLNYKNGLPSDELSCLLEDREGSLWVGSYTGGVARLHQGKIQIYGVAHGLPSVDVRVLYQDSRGVVWAGTQAGLARFNGNGFVVVRDVGAPRDVTSSILEDRNGTLWFGTSGQGLFRLRNGSFLTLTTADGLLSNWIMALYEDADANLWIGTNGEGMNRLRGDELVSIRPADGLWDGIAQTILEDGTGHLWMTSNRGFYRVARADLIAFAERRLQKIESMAFGPGDALRSTLFAGGVKPAGAVDRQGHLWLPSNKGLVIVDPLNLPNSGPPPVARLENVVLNGVSHPAGDEVVLPPGSTPLTLRFTAMTLLNSDRVRFRYQLEGITTQWVDAGSNREVSFASLPHGSYRFVLAASLDGLRWSEADDRLTVTVKPHFHQTLWFRLFALVLGAITLAAVFRLRTQSLRARHDEMERLVALRTDELRLANEHLSRLSFVDALTGLANRRRFNDALDEEWRRACRSETSLALIMADIDNFKLYNDALGHQEGDHCLAAVAAVFLRAAGRAGDLAARYGGEEMVFLMPGANETEAKAMAESIRAACEALAIAHPTSPIKPVVTISLGVASCIPSAESSAESLLSHADSALYRAKSTGRNRVC
ncbi:MAG: diguanylate cyclase [Rhodoferax sp.]|uniref:ligand-binding sensor domain-containing diguanylate cyclase n=1 Tax=Rhodoferax sp. TaxID=50421 RepID=UPI001B756C92|nr:two-component regulator propeller domain-containing protein [Rhodoferax sp.]MBP9904484.1 diguanylate cyclase [Rhodoferax sp.]